MCVNPVPTARISLTTDIGEFQEIYVEKIPVFSKANKNTEHFTWKPKYVYIQYEIFARLATI